MENFSFFSPVKREKNKTSSPNPSFQKLAHVCQDLMLILITQATLKTDSPDTNDRVFLSRLTSLIPLKLQLY